MQTADESTRGLTARFCLSLWKVKDFKFWYDNFISSTSGYILIICVFIDKETAL
jgi:hypothetical protein